MINFSMQENSVTDDLYCEALKWKKEKKKGMKICF